MCRVFNVSRSGYYCWLRRKPSKQQLKREHIAAQIKTAHAESHEIYGYRKVHEELIQTMKITACSETVRRIMAKLGLRSKVKRKYVVTTDSGHLHPVAKNILDRDFEIYAPNLRWVADITYIRTYEGWLYLAAVMDLFSKMIVGWSFSDTIDADLVCRSFRMAVLQRQPPKGLLHHSDRGVQYASDNFQALLEDVQAECSMSRKGDPWDNACMESFFGKLKNELIGKKIYKTHEEAKQEIFWYIEMFYNSKRRHASLGYKSPAEYERHAKLNQAA
jgi:putative transposase